MSSDDDKIDKVRCVWVLSGAPQAGVPSALKWRPGPDRVVAADGGIGLARTLGLVPDLVIGDMDSADPLLLTDLEQRGVPLRRYEHDTKSETDTELALLAALRWEPQEIVVLGAIGGRLDHTIANVLLLTHDSLRSRTVTIVDGSEELFLAKPGMMNEVRGSVGDTVSLLPVGGDVSGVTLEGFEYPLADATLLLGRSQGISNVLTQDTGSILLGSGLLLVVIGHASP